MRHAAFVALALAACAAPAFAGPDGAIELYPNSINPDGFTGPVDFGACVVTETVLFGGILHKVAFSVYARLYGATTAGISGAEFYVEGVETSQLPAGWTRTILLSPGALAMGDISEPHIEGAETVRRVNLTWSVDGPEDPDCQKNYLTFLARIELLSSFGMVTPIAQQTWVRVMSGNPPSDNHLVAPSLTLCDFPQFTPLCEPGGALIINPYDPSSDICQTAQAVDIQSACTVSVENETWSDVKSLYR